MYHLNAEFLLEKEISLSPSWGCSNRHHKLGAMTSSSGAWELSAGRSSVGEDLLSESEPAPSQEEHSSTLTLTIASWGCRVPQPEGDGPLWFKPLHLW